MRGGTAKSRKYKIKGVPLLARTIQGYEIDNKTLEYFQDTWRNSTRKGYLTHINRWALWAIERGVSVLNPKMANVLKYLRMYFESGVGYGAVNMARCALSVILPRKDGNTIGEHFLIRWFCKSCHERRPPQPRYDSFWSVNIMLDWIAKLGNNSALSLKLLSYKLTLLLLLVSSQRGQTILALSIDRMRIEDKAVVFKMKTLLKHNQLGQPLDSIRFHSYTEDRRLCVVRTIKRYLVRTADLRKQNNQLLVSYIGPHGPISRATLARWTLSAMKLAGINTEKYKGHSIRGASASSAKELGASLNAIMRNASWRDSKSFAKYYHKTVEDPGVVQRLLLRNNKRK